MATIAAALGCANDKVLRRPARIAIKENGKFNEVAAMEFSPLPVQIATS